MASWNAFDDFYVNVPATGGSGNFTRTDWTNNAGKIPFDTGLTTTNAWSYAGGNFNGNGFPSSVGTYVSGGGFYPLTSGGQFAGPGASYLLGGTDFWIGYNDSYGSVGLPNALTQIGKYTKEWFTGAPSYTANPDGVNNKYLWLQGTGLSPSTDGLGAILMWNAPSAGTYSFSGSYVNGNYGQSTSFAIVDSSNNVLLSKRTLAAASSVSTFAFTNTYAQGDTVQFQTGTPAAAQGSPLGLEVKISLALAINQTPAALSTMYGSASSSTFFTASGSLLTNGILVTAPGGFEVSTNNSTFSPTVTARSSGATNSTTVFLRLAASTIPGTYSGNIVLSGSNTTIATVATAPSTVSPKALAVTNVAVVSKIYDGGTSASITGSLNGVVVSDVVTLNGTGSFASANAGTNISVTSTSTLGGANASNYTLSQPTGLTGTITPKALSVTAPTIASKVYDGTTTAGAVTVGTISGTVNTQTVSATATAAAYSSANAGSYASTVSYTLDNGTNGGLAANYSLANGSATGTITKATPAVTTPPTATSITYSQTLSASTISGGSVAPSGGTWAWTSPSMVPSPGTAAYPATYTPPDTTNYNTTTANVTLTMSGSATTPQARNSGGSASPNQPATVYLGDTNRTFGAETSGAIGSSSGNARLLLSYNNSNLTNGTSKGYTGWTNAVVKTFASGQFTNTGTWYWGVQMDYGATYGSNHWYKSSSADWSDMSTSGAGSTLSLNVQGLPAPVGIRFSGVSFTQMTLNWTKATNSVATNGYNVLVLRSTNSGFAEVPSNGTAYSTGNSIGGATVVYKGSSNSITIPNLTPGTTYYYKLFSENFAHYSAGIATNFATPSSATSWNAFNEFYVNVPATNGSGDFTRTDWINNAGLISFDSGLTASNTWSYAGGNFNGVDAPSGVGTYLSPASGLLYPLTSGGTYAGPGASYLLGGQDFYIGYNDSYGSVGLPNAQTQIGKYTREWFGGSPNYTNNANGVNNRYLWLQGTGLAPTTDGLGAILIWTAPKSGTFKISGSYVNGNYGPSTSFAIVDSRTNTLLSKRTLLPSSSVSTFAFTNTYAAGDAIQFQVGTPAAAQGSPLGLAVDIIEPPPAPLNAPWDSVDQAVQPFLKGLVEQLPFAFRYGGTSSRDLLTAWTRTIDITEVDAQRTKVSMKFTDPATQLEMRAEATIYRDFPAAEWVLWFRNGGSYAAPLLDGVNALDLQLPTTAAADPTLSLNYNRGTYVEAPPGDAKLNSFQPDQVSLGASSQQSFMPYGGRPSDKFLPFFRLDSASGRSGLFWGIGWTGQWAAKFARDDAGATSVTAGIAQMKASLQPGEEIRTPSILVMAWSGNNAKEGQNQFRRLLLEHYTPRIDENPVVPPISAGVHAIIPFENTSEANLLACITNIAARNLPVDNFWLDAGWYTCPPASGTTNGWDKTTGSWTPDPIRFPNGLRPVADAAKNNGMDFLVWFEPERVMPGTWLATNHPEWLLAPAAGLLPERDYQVTSGFRLLDFGNPQALAWAKSYFSDFVRSNGVTIFRNDCNLHPSIYWRNNEPADRIGMREIRHVMGLYDFWDTLVARNPGLKLDVCAGLGSRIDFEVMRRAMNLTRADGPWWEPVPDQARTAGHAPWTPHTGIGATSDANYNFRSGMGAVFCANFDFLSTNAADWTLWRQLMGQVNDLREIYTGDFYPLTQWSVAETNTAAWQYIRPDLGKSLVQVFRRGQATMPTNGYTLRLEGLDSNAIYVVTDVDNPSQPTRVSGSTLMNSGLVVSNLQPSQSALLLLQLAPTISNAPSASVITYGQALSSSILTGGVASVSGSFAWSTPLVTPLAGTSNYCVIFTPDDTNIPTATTNASVTVNRATPTITESPTASGIVQGQTLAFSSLSGGAANPPGGTFAFTAPSTIPPVGTNSQSVTYTPTDPANYNFATTDVSLTVTSLYYNWSRGAEQTSNNIAKYAIGGATDISATNGVVTTNTATSSDLSITAIVRTNDPGLVTIGQSILNLGGTWSSNDVTWTDAADQSGVPSGNARRIFTTPFGDSDNAKFLRLRSTYTNQ